jgi:hypothetical protein
MAKTWIAGGQTVGITGRVNAKREKCLDCPQQPTQLRSRLSNVSISYEGLSYKSDFHGGFLSIQAFTGHSMNHTA